MSDNISLVHIQTSCYADSKLTVVKRVIAQIDDVLRNNLPTMEKSIFHSNLFCNFFNCKVNCPLYGDSYDTDLCNKYKSVNGRPIKDRHFILKFVRDVLLKYEKDNHKEHSTHRR